MDHIILHFGGKILHNQADLCNSLNLGVNNEGFIQLYAKIVRLKLLAADGKMRETDTTNTETLFRIIQSIPSPKAEPFKRWLAQIRYKLTWVILTIRFILCMYIAFTTDMIFSSRIALLGPFITAYDQSDLFGRLIILGLVFLSVLCWMLLLYKIWMTRHVQRVSHAFYHAYRKNKNALLQLDVKDLPKPLKSRVPHPFGELFSSLQSKTLEILNKNLYFSEKEKSSVHLSPADLEMIENSAWMTITAQIKQLEKNLFVLSTIVTLAPFLGLLGTVWGILMTFSQLQTGASISSNSAILGGLSTALVTTVLGLVIAIPALISYNYLKSTIKDYSSDMEDFLYDVLSTVELQYRKADV
jgi:biopolymer transport protein TolQ